MPPTSEPAGSPTRSTPIRSHRRSSRSSSATSPTRASPASTHRGTGNRRSPTGYLSSNCHYCSHTRRWVMEMLRKLEPLALFFVIVGALNWGILGITGGETNVLHEIFGAGTFLDVLYVIVGVC